MKYQRLASLGAVLFGAAATVSAKHLGGRHEHNQCPKGYTVSVYTSYSTVYLTSTPSAAPEVTSTSSPVAIVETPAPVEATTPVGDDATSSSTTSSTPVQTSEATVAATTQATVAVVAELSTENAVAAATTSAVSSTSISIAQAAASTSSSSTTTSSSSGSISGEATFYGGNVAGGTCSYSGYTLPSGLLGTAFSGAAWDNAAKCGACVAVTGPKGNTIKAMVSQVIKFPKSGRPLQSY